MQQLGEIEDLAAGFFDNGWNQEASKSEWLGSPFVGASDHGHGKRFERILCSCVQGGLALSFRSQFPNMQLDPRFQERIAVIVTVVVGILGAIMLGKMTAQGQTGTIAMIAFGAVAVASLLHFRERVWVIIPVLWPFHGAVQILPLPFALKDIGVMVGFSAIIVCIALKIVRMRPKFTYLDALLYLNALWLLVAFVRNPVGFFEADSERVGGRPYVSAGFGLFGYWSLCRLSAPVATMRRLPMYVLAGVAAVFIINVALVLFPQIAPFAAAFYSGFDFYFVDGMSATMTGQSAGETAIDAGTVRIELFRDIGRYTVVFLCAYFLPSSLVNVLKWRQSLFFGLAILGLLLSGFRSFIVYAAAMFLLGSYFRKGWIAVFRASIIGALAALLVMLGHGTLYELPFAAQRALAVIPKALRPTQLDEVAVLTGESSTDWRVEMWIQALTTNRYISDKVLGDGFGMTRMQIAAYQRAASRGAISNEDSQEHMAISGDFHSGPISTIRVVGYVGLVFVYMLMFAMALRAVQLIRRCNGTPLFEPSLFFLMPVVFEPLWFTLVFGAYSMWFPFIAVSLGMMKVIENSLEASERTQTPLLPIVNTRRAAAAALA